MSIETSVISVVVFIFTPLLEGPELELLHSRGAENCSTRGKTRRNSRSPATACSSHNLLFYVYFSGVSVILFPNGHNIGKCSISVYSIITEDWSSNTNIDGRECSAFISCSTGFEETIIIEATGHTESAWIPGEGATCGEPGTQYKECTVCHEVLITEEVDAVGHVESDWIVEKEVTCEEDGYKYKECTNCHEKLAEETIECEGHKSSDWIVMLEATETESGVKYKECTECHERLAVERIPATGNKQSSDSDSGCGSVIAGVACAPVVLSAAAFVFMRKHED